MDEVTRSRVAEYRAAAGACERGVMPQAAAMLRFVADAIERIGALPTGLTVSPPYVQVEFGPLPQVAGPDLTEHP